jgi:integrase
LSVFDTHIDIYQHFANIIGMKFTAIETSSGKVHKGTLGNVTVKIYEHARQISRRGKHAGKRTVFQVVDNTHGKGRRALRGFSTFAEAAAEAERLAKLISTGQTAAATLTNADAASFGRTKELLRGIDVPLEMVAANYAKAYNILGGDRIVEAAKDFNRRYPVKRAAHSVRKVAGEMVELQTMRGKSPIYLMDLRWRLSRFAEAFKMDVARVTTADVQKWLDGMKAAPRSVKNFRAVASSLFKFAEARGYIAKGENPVIGTERIKIRNGEPIAIFTPAELRRLLAAAKDSFKPVIALQAFAGLRSAEVMRLDWRDVKLSRGHIELGADKTKTAARRLVPISANLREWLAEPAKKTGKVFPHGRAYFHELQRDAATATETQADAKTKHAALAPVQWKQNALRHSFISYRVAETGDVPRVALESGNSPAMIFTHYRELVTPEDAMQWFAIAPAKDKAAPQVTVTTPAPAVRNRVLQMN